MKNNKKNKDNQDNCEQEQKNNLKRKRANSL